MEVTFAGRKGEPARAGSVAFDDALATADVVSLHCPLVPETRHLLGRREFGLMQRRPLLINRSEEHTSGLQSLMRISYAVFCLIKKNMTIHDPLHFCLPHNLHIHHNND